MTPTHRSHDMTDKLLREALTNIAEGNLGDAPWQANYDRIREVARAALAAAQQPAPVDREALVEVISGLILNAADAYIEEHDRRAIADALLARGLRLPGGEETMAWAVVGSDGQIKHVTGNGRNLAKQWAEPGDSIKRVAVRVVEGGDDA